MRCQLLERDAVIADQRVEVDTARAQCNKLGREKNKTDADMSDLQMSVDVSSSIERLTILILLVVVVEMSII